MEPKHGGIVRGRALELFSHGAEPEWGYPEGRRFSFGLYHPENEEAGRKYPLVVALHCAGCSYFDSVTSLITPNSMDTLKVTHDEFTLCLDDLDCGPEDYWWGGHCPQAEPTPSHHGTAPGPTEKRIIGTIRWVCENYPIDGNMIYGVGVSMGGSGTLGTALPRGDIFAAIKVCVPAGVGHVSDRCLFGADEPDGFSLPDPPPVFDISAQNDTWSTGHEGLYTGMKEKKYALVSYWGPFGHDSSNERMPPINDLINSFDLFTIKKNEAYPVFLDASCDDVNPWLCKGAEEASGQMNAFFRWKVLSDTADELKMELYIVSEGELETKFTIPAEATADVCLRRLQNLRLTDGDGYSYDFGGQSGSGTVTHGVPEMPSLTITREHKILTVKKK